MAVRSKARFSIYYDTRRKLKDGTHPLRLRLTYCRDSRYIALSFIHWLDPGIPTHLSPEQYEAMNSTNPSKKWKKIKRQLNAVVTQAENIWRNLDPAVDRQDLLEADWQRFFAQFMDGHEALADEAAKEDFDAASYAEGQAERGF